MLKKLSPKRKRLPNILAMMLEKLPQKLKIVKSSETLFEKKPQTIAFPNGHCAQFITASPDAPPKQVAFKLPLTTPSALIMISGDTENLDEIIQQRLTQLLSRGVARAAVDVNAVLMDDGKTSGLVAMTGQGVADRGYKSPLIGVASAAQVTYPGQSETPARSEATPLEPNHTHFVLVDAQNTAREIEFRYNLGAALATNMPTLTILANGTEQSRTEILQAVRLGWPIIVLSGTGQLADEITALYQDRPDFIADPVLAEIIADGNILLFPVEGEVEKLERLIHRQFRGDDTLKLAWEQFAVYDKNAARQQKSFYRLQFALVVVGVLGTLLALLQASLDLQIQEAQQVTQARDLISVQIQSHEAAKCKSTETKTAVKKQTNIATSSQSTTTPESSTENGKSTENTAENTNDTFTDFWNALSSLYDSIKISLSQFWNWLSSLCRSTMAETEKKAKKLLKDEPEPEIRIKVRDSLKIIEKASCIAKFVASYSILNTFTTWLVAFLQWVIVAIPVVITVLVAVSNRFNAGQKWISLRSTAETLKSEIFCYRTQAGAYSAEQCVDRSREAHLANKIQELNNHLMQTEVNLSALQPYQGPLPPQYSTAENDEGFAVLSPERYLNARLEDQLNYYVKKTGQLEHQLSRLQWAIYILGGVGTLLAARGLELWIAFTTGLVAAIGTYLGYQQVEERLKKYNQAAINLTNIRNWWSALPSSEQAKQDKIDKLILETETALGSEFQEWVQKMQKTMSALKETQAKAAEKAKAKLGPKKGPTPSPAQPSKSEPIQTTVSRA
jgi:type II secretory pathway pseudopilin PulG